MKKIKYLLLIVLLIPIVLFTGGCSNDSMDNIEIIVTNYPNEYIVKKLYDNMHQFILFIQMALILIIIQLVKNKN